MLRSILNRAKGSRGRATGTATPRRKPTSGGSANSEIATGAKSLLRGASRKKRGR